ncbi:MAG: aromatic acid exporter family protein [Enterocloster asparagiformis]|nr:aromatic acid exporter family protein [Enterocloster asparagiformis]
MRLRVNGLKMIKIAGGSLLAMVIAEGLGLRYGASAGVIALLSIHDTKRETIRAMAKRLGAFCIALTLAPVCFGLAGYRPLAIGLFLLLFAPVCSLLQIQEGLSVSTVLMTHFLSDGGMPPGSIVNELLLLAVGAGVGVGMNLYIPGKRGWIRGQQRRIEEQFRHSLLRLAGILEGEDGQEEAGEHLAVLERMLEEGEAAAYRDIQNNLLSETEYYLHYMMLRKNQLTVLNRILGQLRLRTAYPEQSRWLSGLMRSIGRSFHEHNNALILLEELNGVKGQLKRQPLPVTREEFEARAILYQVLLELEQFLLLKREFVEGLTEKEIGDFWKINEGDRE